MGTLVTASNFNRCLFLLYFMAKMKQLGRKSKVVSSKYFDQIMKSYEENKHLSAIDFYHNFVRPVDPEITYDNWVGYLRSLKKRKEKKIQELIEEAAVSEIELYNRIRNTAYQLGDKVMMETVDEIRDIIDRGERIPDKKKNMIMKWFFKQKELDQADRVIDLKVKGDAREERLVDVILKESIYARDSVSVNEIETLEAEFEEVENAPKTIRQLAAGEQS